MDTVAVDMKLEPAPISYTAPIKSAPERKKFVLAAYSSGEGRIARAQYLAEQAGKNSLSWADVQQFLESAGDSVATAKQTRAYVDMVPLYEAEFAMKSPANKNLKRKIPQHARRRCTEGRWRTIEGRPVFICAS